ncbi:MAG: FecR domain-containing protein [Verrucomicrobiia bacterium]
MLSAIMCGTMLVLAVAVSAQTLTPGVATIIRIQGEARYSLGDGSWHPLLAGKMLGPGSILQTGHNGTVDMVLGRTVEMPQASPWPDRIGPAPDANIRGLIDYKPSVEQNMVRMTGDTMLAIDTLTILDTGVDAVSDTELDLKQGRIFCSVRKLSAASQYLIKIPNGIAGVRGTLFEIDASGWCAVLKHSVLIALAGPDSATMPYVVGEGNQFNPATGLVSPLPSDMLNLLQQMATALDTVYVEIVSFTYDGTFCFISPTTGHY